ncbi:hypothetical protein DFH27DRAFT_616748 [Peziza echinospora]|nr:hypothetical protein DFH27DRAFT_616748 [Peziza echinospora]
MGRMEDVLDKSTSLLLDGRKIWTTEKLSTLLHNHFEAVCDFGLRVREWQQIAVVCSRAMTGEWKRLETKEEIAIGNTVGELQAGHAHTVAVLNYAVISSFQLVQMQLKRAPGNRCWPEED